MTAPTITAGRCRRTVERFRVNLPERCRFLIIALYGAGRTDAGVHAEAQVANFFAERPFEPYLLRDAINGNVDRDIRVQDVEPVSDAFNARYSARKKTYRYRICTAEVVNPFIYRYVHHYRSGLNTTEMQHAASAMVGTHDFSAFTVASSDAEDHIRTLMDLAIEPAADEVLITASADGFLRYMVRTIVGTLIEVGRGKRTAASVAAALESLDRSKAGPSAPANGLTLVRVDY
jgi:tRNA pseudouridine38-40 synthase